MIELKRIKLVLLATVALVSSTATQAMMEQDPAATPSLKHPSDQQDGTTTKKRRFRLDTIRTLCSAGVQDNDVRKKIANAVVNRWGRGIDDHSLISRAQAIAQNVDLLFLGHDCIRFIVDSALALSPEEIQARAAAIRQNKAILMPLGDRTVFGLWYFSIVQRALGLSSQEINARVQTIRENGDILFPEGIDITGRLTSIGRVLAIDANAYEIGSRAQAIRENGEILFPEGIEISDRLKSIFCVLDLAVAEINPRAQAIREYGAILFPEGIGVKDRSHLTRKTLKLPVDEIKSRMQAIRDNQAILFPAGIRVDDRVRVMQQVLKLRAAVIESRLQAIKENGDILFPRGITKNDYFKIIRRVLRFNTDKIRSHLQAIKENGAILFPHGIGVNHHLSIVREALKLPAEEIRKSYPVEIDGEWELETSVEEEIQEFELSRIREFGVLPVEEQGSKSEGVEGGGITDDYQSHEDYLIRPENLPFKFNVSFQGKSKQSGVPEGHEFVQDPQQKAKTKWGPLSILSTRKGRVAITGDGYVFYYQLASTEMKPLDQKSFVFEVDVRSPTPGTYIQYWGFPHSQKIMSRPYERLREWETLRIEFMADGKDSKFFLYPAIMPAMEIKGSKPPKVEVRNVRLYKGQ